MRIKTHSRGFTLVEILVVVLITGITLGFALLAFGDFGEKRRIIIASEQFASYVKLIQQQAILETNTFGITVNKDNYLVQRLQPGSTWSRPMSGIYQRTQTTKGLVISNDSSNNKRGQPTIIINASGDMTPFTLDFGDSKHTRFSRVIGKRNGHLTINVEPTP